MSLDDFTEMKVHRLVLDPNTNSPIVVLLEEATGTMLPIWIGIFEAHSIAMRLEGVAAARPMTHDLLRSFLDVTKSMVDRIEVHDLVENTYFARIHFLMDQKPFAIDSRPSDAIALALRTISPIFVANHVLEQSRIDPGEAGLADSGPDDAKWEEILRNYKGEGDDTKYN